jgi:hypothetical protein
MSHWSDAYLGRPYVPESFNCGDMAIDVQQQVFRRALEVVGAHPRGRGAQTEAIEAALMAHVVPVEVPIDGDVVLLWNKGRRRHVGVYCALAGGMILHACVKAGVVRTAVRDLHLINMAVEGYYRPC